MFDALKYILDESGQFMNFSPVTHHKTAYRAMSNHSYEKCIGAGFISLSGGKVRCWGRSESLNIASNGVLDSESIAPKLGLESIS